ncbi:MAG: DNA-3-methyladenine glycosylase I [Candidatus Hodarchaeales archaeon]
MNPEEKLRCEWALESQVMKDYHDKEWGVPVHNDYELFELLILEGAQAGLSWSTILGRREGYRKAFANFDYEQVAQFTDDTIEALLQDTSIIRNRLKIKSAVNNARQFIKVQKEFGTFDKYIWSFTDYEVIHNNFNSLTDIPAYTPLSKNISKDLKKRGFSFIGPTICYAFLQSIGILNDHVTYCYRYNELKQ